MLHTVTLVEAARERVHDVVLWRELLLGIWAAEVVTLILRHTMRCIEAQSRELRQRLAAHLGKSLGHSKETIIDNLDTLDTEYAVATLGHLLDSHRAHLLGTLRGLERHIAANLDTIAVAIGVARNDAIGTKLHAAARIYGATYAATLQRLCEADIVVAVYLHTLADAIHTVGLYPIALDTVDVGADEVVVGHEAEAIACYKLLLCGYAETLACDTLHRAYVLANGLGRVERGNTCTLAREHILTTIAREALLRVGRELHLGATRRCTHTIGALKQRLVDLAAVVAHHILHIAHILQTSLDLKRHNARIDHIADALREVEILDREQMLALDKFLA